MKKIERVHGLQQIRWNVLIVGTSPLLVMFAGVKAWETEHDDMLAEADSLPHVHESAENECKLDAGCRAFAAAAASLRLQQRLHSVHEHFFDGRCDA